MTRPVLNRPRLKLAAMLIGIFVILFLAVSGTLTSTTRSQVCAKCHMMKPEVYTLQHSTHKEVDCAACHVKPGTLNLVKYNVRMVERLFRSVTGMYLAPIKMTDVIPNEACNTCHSMDFRRVTPSGDLIIPHSVHEKQGLACVKCHKGIAHGEIASRQVTYQGDYGKWNADLAQSLMGDSKYVKPDMDTCTTCHRLKGAPLGCSACHSSTMRPADHKQPGFDRGAHGVLGAKDVSYCDTCHGYMSQEKVAGLEKRPSYIGFLGKGSAQPKVTIQDYAKQNTFCKDCHGKRPVTHNSLFNVNHGVYATGNLQRCLTCHNQNGRDNSSVTQVSCNSCHPSTHGQAWRGRHPVPLPAKTHVTQLCYQCHNQALCSGCHTAQ